MPGPPHAPRLHRLFHRPAPQNDAKKLAEAKQLVYLKGFTDGVLIVGEYAGKKVRVARGGCLDTTGRDLPSKY